MIALEPDIWLTQVTLDDFDVRGALILGGTRVVVWDTLSHPRDMRLFEPLIGDRDIVIVMVDTESEGKALLKAPADCPYDTKIYAFDGLSTKDYLRLEERFPSAVLFTRITE